MMYKRYDNDGDSDSLDVYLKQIRKIPLLTLEEEKELCERRDRGDSTAKEKLVSSNLRFVIKIAKQYLGQGLPLEDLIAEGNFGLIRAAEKFDYTKAKFSTYSHWWIKQGILRALALDTLIHIPIKRIESFGKILHLQKEGKTLEEISNITGKDINKLKQILNLRTLIVSLDSPLSEEEDLTYNDLIPDENYSPERGLNPERKVLFSILDKLPKREAEVIKLRFGFIDGASHTLEEVGLRYGVTRERVRQIENRALRRLRNPLYKSTLESCFENVNEPTR